MQTQNMHMHTHWVKREYIVNSVRPQLCLVRGCLQTVSCHSYESENTNTHTHTHTHTYTHTRTHTHTHTHTHIHTCSARVSTPYTHTRSARGSFCVLSGQIRPWPLTVCAFLLSHSLFLYVYCKQTDNVVYLQRYKVNDCDNEWLEDWFLPSN